MNSESNTKIIAQLYRDFSAGNINAVLSNFDKEIVWIRPGAPVIPFAGVFKGLDGMGHMFELIRQTIRLTSFLPKKFCSNDDTVVVLGSDTAEVIATGKTYASDWVQSFTLKNNKIVHVQVYIDTLGIADAFQS